MKIGMGIDTGGTYTDAVIYDFQQKKILGAVKSLTTKSDLSEGISNALDGLPQELLSQVELVSLSTTLATNACVENKGGRAKLLFINVYKKVVDETGLSYGLPKSDKIFFLNGPRDKNGVVIGEPDWNVFLDESAEWFADADSIGIVELNAMYNGASVEKKAQRLILDKYDIPVIGGHELFSDLNSIQRGSSTLLNARLLPIVGQFLKAVKSSLEKRNINAPVVIVRSDGSLMSEKFTGTHPVETLLCGPAASVVGGIELTNEKDCLIIDMGGTTTDISLVKGGIPVLAENGVNVGKWRTFVKGVFTETIGLGGDSAVRTDGNSNLVLASFRVVPLAIAASQWPQVTENLRKLVYEKKSHSLPLHEFFMLIKDISNNLSYSDKEKAFCAALKGGPLIYREAAQAMGKDIYSFNVKRLENEGVVIRCGLTPTDVMHVKGDFNRYDTRAAELGIEFVARSANVEPSDLSDMVYETVKKALYTNILKVILEDSHPAFRKTSLGRALETLISENWTKTINNENPKDFLNISLSTPAVLVGIGAPIHVFLPDVARALGTKCVIPENAGVANALGAIIGNISVTCEINVDPIYSADGINGYIVRGRNENSIVTSLDEALSKAMNEARAGAGEEALRRGAVGDISISVETTINKTSANNHAEVLLGLKAIAKALGRINL